MGVLLQRTKSSDIVNMYAHYDNPIRPPFFTIRGFYIPLNRLFKLHILCQSGHTKLRLQLNWPLGPAAFFMKMDTVYDDR